MCVVALTALTSAITGTGAATAAGATATAATAASGLATLGTLAATAGSLWQGMQGARAARMQADALEEQAKTEQQLTAVKDQRTRARFMSETREQFAQLAARGVALDSPTAILLGQTAAQEMSFESQAIRSEGGARQTELSASQRIARGQARQSMIGGMFNAAGTMLTAAPKLWPEMLR